MAQHEAAEREGDVGPHLHYSPMLSYQRKDIWGQEPCKAGFP